jgi:hypothetical protein
MYYLLIYIYVNIHEYLYKQIIQIDRYTCMRTISIYRVKSALSSPQMAPLTSDLCSLIIEDNDDSVTPLAVLQMLQGARYIYIYIYIFICIYIYMYIYILHK